MVLGVEEGELEAEEFVELGEGEAPFTGVGFKPAMEAFLLSTNVFRGLFLGLSPGVAKLFGFVVLELGVEGVF